jgi:Raf kinase inhibitor-like YbhB/YbcL family protein
MKELAITLGFQSYPAKHTCEGENVSPRISIKGMDAPYFAIILDDPDAPSGTYVHWVIWNIRGGDEVPENVTPTEHPEEIPGAVQGLNSTGKIGYTGPCPPSGKAHCYFLKVYGFDAPLSLAPGASKYALEDAMKGHVRQYGEAMATFARQ